MECSIGTFLSCKSDVDKKEITFYRFHKSNNVNDSVNKVDYNDVENENDNNDSNNDNNYNDNDNNNSNNSIIIGNTVKLI